MTAECTVAIVMASNVYGLLELRVIFVMRCSLLKLILVVELWCSHLWIAASTPHAYVLSVCLQFPEFGHGDETLYSNHGVTFAADEIHPRLVKAFSWT